MSKTSLFIIVGTQKGRPVWLCKGCGHGHKVMWRDNGYTGEAIAYTSRAAAKTAITNLDRRGFKTSMDQAENLAIVEVPVSVEIGSGVER